MQFIKLAKLISEVHCPLNKSQRIDSLPDLPMTSLWLSKYALPFAEKGATPNIFSLLSIKAYRLATV